MAEAVDPLLRAGGEGTVLGADVVGLAKVVPGADLDERDLVAVSDQRLPAGDPEVLVTVEHELQNHNQLQPPPPPCSHGHSRSC